MGRLGVAKDDVEMACRALEAKGKAVTVANVRAELGTGSYTTLLPLIQEFLAKPKKQAQAADTASVDVPKVVSDLGAKLVSDLWLEAERLSNEKVEALKREYEERLVKLEDKLIEREHELGQAFHDIKELEKSHEESSKALEEKSRRLTEIEGANALLRDQLKSKDDEIQKLIERAVRAESELGRTS